VARPRACDPREVDADGIVSQDGIAHPQHEVFIASCRAPVAAIVVGRRGRAFAGAPPVRRQCAGTDVSSPACSAHVGGILPRLWVAQL
jgi:hypothetical protein